MYDSMTKSITGTISKDGLMGLYKGYGITIMREIPFSFIQFPIYEKLKIVIAEITNRTPKSYEAALCGSFAGGIAGNITCVWLYILLYNFIYTYYLLYFCSCSYYSFRCN